MLASYKWLKELCELDATPQEVADKFTSAGLEVEGIKAFGDLPGVVVAEVRAKRKHPERDKLSLVTVFDGEGEREVVCGAPNVPEPGKRILFAREGATLPGGFKITPKKLGGIESRGMICSETELDIGSGEDGIYVMADDEPGTPGQAVSEAMGLADWVFEIGLTPNRPDCLGHLGLARELSALFSAKLRLPRPGKPRQLLRAPAAVEGSRPVPLFDGPTADWEARAVPIKIVDAERCPRYSACVVEDVKVGPSPFWLRYRLHVLGLRAINNAVDITNLVLLEYGYPTHAFDLSLLGDRPRIDVRVGAEGETITTLDEVERKVGADDLLICDGNGPVAVAGVMGGERSGVQDNTTSVLVECAYFDPRSVRRASRRLGLHTDSSHRFERGVDPRAVPGVLARVAGLLAELADATPCQHGFEVYPTPVLPKEITLRAGRAEGLLGMALPEGKAAEVLQALGCTVQPQKAGALKVTAPTWRPDLTREEDLIEEIARVYGYHHIPTQVPTVKASEGGTAPLTRFLRRLRERAAAVGLLEAVNYAFVAPRQLKLSRVPTEAVKLANPLSEERSVMRTSLLPGLAANLGRAQRHQVPTVRIFEVARTFHPTGEILPTEVYRFGMLLAGPREEWIASGANHDFFDGKGMLEAVLRPLCRVSPETVVQQGLAEDYPCLHPRRCASVVIEGKPVGVLGELHPDVVDDLELTGPVVYAELDVSAVLAAGRADLAPQVHAIPRFPSSSRDLAVEVDDTTQAGDVAAALREAGGALVEEVTLFDLYRGEQVAEGKKSLAFRVTYRDPEATLTDKKVDKAHAKVVKQAKQRFGDVRQ